MSADHLPELPPDALSAIAEAKKLVVPHHAVRARMRARLAKALPPPDGGGEGGDGGEGGAGGPAPSPPRALPSAPLWMVAAALAVGGVAGFLVPRAPVERVVIVHAPPSVTPVALVPQAPSAPSLPSIAMSDLPSLPSAVADAAPARRGDELAAERAALDVARTALGRGDGANALTACDEHARRFPRGALAEEREAIAVQALVLEQRTADARARAERFRKTHPRSILLPAVLAAAGIEP
jgi:hypothetical protein